MIRILMCFFVIVYVPVGYGQVNSSSEVVLKSGQKLEGKIIEKTDKYVKMDMGVGVPITYYTDEIASISVVNPPSEIKSGNENQVQNAGVSQYISDLESQDSDVRQNAVVMLSASLNLSWARPLASVMTEGDHRSVSGK